MAAAEGRGELAFGLLLASAGKAKTAGDDRARSTALAEAVTVAHRISGTFEREVPQSLLRDLSAEAARIAPAEDPVLAARLAAAAAWHARPGKSHTRATASHGGAGRGTPRRRPGTDQRRPGCGR